MMVQNQIVNVKNVEKDFIQVVVNVQKEQKHKQIIVKNIKMIKIIVKNVKIII